MTLIRSTLLPNGFLPVSPVSLARRQTREIGARLITWVLFLEGNWELNLTIASGPENADSRESGGEEEAEAQLLRATSPANRCAILAWGMG